MESEKLLYIRYKSANFPGFSISERMSLTGLLRSYPRDMGMEDPGFEYVFADDQDAPDGWRRHLWIHAGEWGYVDGVAQLVRKFLKRFRPEECWSLTYATTCSKPRVGEFGGGAVFVTADAIHWQNAYEFVEQQRAAFTRSANSHQEETEHGETAATKP